MSERHGIAALSEREKETLRLLLSGHDSKSIARRFGLSVHTVNERLRDARRKLEVSSSREAARLLLEAERADPDSFGDKRIGLASGAPATSNTSRAIRPESVGSRFAWLSGGMLVMSLIVAAIALSMGFHGNGASQPPAAAAQAASDSAEVRSAGDWTALVDHQRWNESWAAAGTLFRSAISQEGWASKIKSVRDPLGAVSSRTVQNVTKASKLPGAPDGEYEIIQFQTDFANHKDATETVVLARENSAWKVDGYFIR